MKKDTEAIRRAKRLLLEEVIVIINRWHWNDSPVLMAIEKQLMELKETLCEKQRN